MRRRRFSGPPREARVAECRRCGAKVVWLPHTACCTGAAACYSPGGTRPPACQGGQGEGYCGKRDGPVDCTRRRVALWAAGAEGGDGKMLTGYTIKGDKVTGRELAPNAAELRAEAAIMLRHICDPFAVVAHRAKAAAAARGEDLDDEQAPARAWAQSRAGGQDRAAGEG